MIGDMWPLWVKPSGTYVILVCFWLGLGGAGPNRKWTDIQLQVITWCLTWMQPASTLVVIFL